MSTPPTTSIEPELSEHAITASPPFLGLATARLRVLGMKSALSVVDQGLTSGAGFVVNFVLARWLAAPVYGAFAVAFSSTLFVSGFHNVLVLEPISVFGPAHHSSNLFAYFRAHVGVHFFLAGVLSAAGFLASIVLWLVNSQSPLTSALVGASAALPFFLLLWLVRRMCYVVQEPSLAVSGSVAYFVAMVFGLLSLRYRGYLSPFSVFLLLGVSSLFGSVILLWRLAHRVTGNRQTAHSTLRFVLRENWSYGRWLVGSAVLFALSSQTQMFLAAGILGLSAAGILRAMQLPSLLMTQVITAVGLLVLPSFSYDFGKGLTERLRKKAIFVSVGLTGGALCFAVFLLICGAGTEHLLYAGKYAAYATLMPVLALMPVFSSLGLGFSMALRASQKPHFDLISNACAAPVAVVTAFIFMRFWGIAGAVASMVLSLAVLNIVTMMCFRSHSSASKWATEPARGDELRLIQ